MDEKRLANRLKFLCHKLFIENADGKEFIKLMKLFHVMTPTFPQPLEVVERHGGPLSWAGFREGQITLIRSLEMMAIDYNNRLDAEIKSKE